MNPEYAKWKAIFFMSPLNELFKIGKSIESESWLAIVRKWEKGKWRLTASGYTVSLQNDEMFWN